MIWSGVSACLLVVPSVTAGPRLRDRTLSLRRLFLRFGLSLLGYFGAIATGGLFAAGNYGSGFGWLFVVAVVLLLISLPNT